MIIRQRIYRQSSEREERITLSKPGTGQRRTQRGRLCGASGNPAYRINRTIHAEAGARGLLVAEVSAYFQPPWRGKFASDAFPARPATATGPRRCWPC
jgi:hypothetical protein